ncbi:MAG: hypothetical protein AAFQ82_12145 [Myxococcota bacterium]
MMRKFLDEERSRARTRAEQAFDRRERLLARAHRRALVHVSADERDELAELQELEVESLDFQRHRVLTAVEQAVPRLYTVIAVRLMRAKSVSG